MALDHISLVVVAAGTCCGLIAGAGIASEAERLQRRAGVIRQVIQQLLIALAFTACAVAILKVGKAYPLRGSDRYVFVAVFFASAFFGKWLRFRYWKHRRKHRWDVRL